MNDTFLTLAAPVHREIPKIKGSRFVADVAPVRTTVDADEVIEKIRAREPDATHHCWAYRLGIGGETYRYNDDGEPSGTAGQPIFRQIDGRDLTDLVVVVTRYYGGTKLGTGGLVHAYGEAAAAVLDAGEKVEQVVREPVQIMFSYDDTSAVRQVLHSFDAEITASTYTDVTEFVVHVRRSAADEFIETVRNALGGRGTVTRPSDA